MTSAIVPFEPPVPVVQVDHLQKVYRSGFWFNQRITSLKDVSLRIEPGETFGLLGPNGAGKTTLLKLLLGIIRPSGGKGELLGRPLGDRQTRDRIGYMPENAYFYDYLTGWEFLDFVGSLFRIPAKERRIRIAELLDLVGLAQSAARKKQLRQYSKGMLQRVGLAQCLINDPEVVFLDEPMSGLDPLGRYQIREIILTLKGEGKTIFFNSHVLSDVEQICDRVAILARGELLCVGSLEELLGEPSDFWVCGTGGTPAVLGQWLEPLQFDEGGWQGILRRPPQDFLASLTLMGGELVAMQRSRQSLEEFFVEQLRSRNILQSE